MPQKLTPDEDLPIETLRLYLDAAEQDYTKKENRAAKAAKIALYWEALLAQAILKQKRDKKKIK